MEWRQVTEFEGLYEVSDAGFVRGIRSGKVLKPATAWNPEYRSQILRKDGKQYSRLSHRIVWISFNGPIPSGFEINHKNGIKKDNALDNLELMTRSQNILHSSKVLSNRHGNRTRGEASRASRLTERQVLEIRSSIGSKSDKAKKFGCSMGAIGHIMKRRSWKHI